MEEIYAEGGRLDFALTLTDSQATTKSGRVFLDDFCARHSIPLFKSRNMNDAEAIEFVRSRSIDWLFVIGWSQIASPGLLATLRRGALGIHPTLLPVGRGRSAIPWTLIKNLPEAGATLFKLDEGVDTGPVIEQEIIPVAPGENATTLYAKVTAAHRVLIRKAWPLIAIDAVREIPQDESRATIWPGRTPEDGRLTPAMPIAEVERLVRAVTHPYPGAFIDVGERRVRIWSGAVASDERPAAGSLRFRFAGGDYDASVWQTEPVHPAGNA